MVDKVPYDEFGLFHENAAEYGLPYDGPPTVSRRSVEVGGGRSLSALVWGSGAPELVLLHGGGQNAHTWDTVAMAMRPRPLVAVDLPGHGHSDRPDDRQLTDPGSLAGAEDVARVITELAPSAAAVVGMSAGGFMAIRVAKVAPHLVRRLVLVDVLPGLDRAHARHIGEFLDGPVTFPSFDELLERTKQFNPRRSESSLRRGILHNALQLDDGSWVWRHQRWRLQDAGATRPVPAPEAQGASNVGPDLWEVIEKLDAPVMLCRGMRSDSVLRDEDEAELKRRRPDALVRHFAEAGHSIQGDMPLELAAAVGEFVP
ncbi:MAG TPA: alpha/beta hydrolase [Acidimicrobiales bacterium]|nr:alpha/beta hydrolase [Acidimicrobiales bacterium]